MSDDYEKGMRELEQAFKDGEKFVLFVDTRQTDFNMKLLWATGGTEVL